MAIIDLDPSTAHDDDPALAVINTALDPSLVDMIRENERIIRSFMHCGGGESLWDADIAWDFPAQVIGGVWDEDAAKLTHAIGFISGVAAACDVTPLELLDLVKQLGPTKREKATAIPTASVTFPAMSSHDDLLTKQGWTPPERIDVTYRCVCSWVGGDPDRWRRKNTCPACWHHDRKRVEVYPDGSPELARALNDHAALALEAADKATRRRTAAQKRQRIKKVR